MARARQRHARGCTVRQPPAAPRTFFELPPEREEQRPALLSALLTCHCSGLISINVRAMQLWHAWRAH
eukprot:7312055-Alexandrium_andersonii.AAC.1